MIEIPFRRYRVAGVSFIEGYPSNLHRLREITEAGGAEPLPVVLRRNPQNRYDANAVEVHVPALGDNGMVGHLPATLAAQLAPHMDEGQQIRSSVYAVAVDPDHPDRPGLEVSIGGQR